MCQSCELSFIWGKIKSADWETAPQIALRNCSKEAGGWSVYMRFWWRGDTCSQAHIFPGFCYSCEAFASHEKQMSPWRILVLFYIRRDLRIGLIKISSWKYLTIWREDLSCQFLPPPAQSTSFLLSTLNPFQGVLKVSHCNSTWFDPCRWKVPICSWLYVLKSTKINKETISYTRRFY